MVIPAAGKGKRMGAPLSKQYLKLEGRPLLAYTLETFLHLKPRRLVVVVAPGEEDLFRQEVFPSLPPYREELVVTAGGAERQDSVYNGIRALPPGIGYICVHDGARPLVTAALVRAVLEAARESGAAAACVPLKDTIKEIDAGGFGVATPPRKNYVAVQTPQIFSGEVLLKALEKAGREGFRATDETALVEKYGGRVRTVPGSFANIKVTTPEDLLWAGVLLKERRRGDADRIGL